MTDVIGVPVFVPPSGVSSVGSVPPSSHVVPSGSASYLPRLAVSLPRYAGIVDYAEAAFFGVNWVGNDKYQCRQIWTHDQRMAIFRELLAAQSDIQEIINYPLLPTWITAEPHNPHRTQLLKYGQIIEMGQKVVDDVAVGVVCDHTNDPVSMSLGLVSFTDPDEVHVYHPGTDMEIYPSGVSITSGVLSIQIPRVRMVAVANENNDESGLDYADTSLFEQTVDIRREYVSTVLPSAVWVVTTGCGDDCPDPTQVDGCARIKDAEIGSVRVGLAGKMNCVCAGARFVNLYYRAGLVSLSPAAEDVIVRYAHSRMPSEPCGCDILKMRWDDDKKTPDILTRERINCPFGTSNGSWLAWRFAQGMRLVRGGTL